MSETLVVAVAPKTEDADPLALAFSERPLWRGEMLPPDISLFLGELCAFGSSGVTRLVRSLLHRLRPMGVDILRQL